jgi:hypothetical protein
MGQLTSVINTIEAYERMVQSEIDPSEGVPGQELVRLQAHVQVVKGMVQLPNCNVVRRLPMHSLHNRCSLFLSSPAPPLPPSGHVTHLTLCKPATVDAVVDAGVNELIQLFCRVLKIRRKQVHLLAHTHTNPLIDYIPARVGCVATCVQAACTCRRRVSVRAGLRDMHSVSTHMLLHRSVSTHMLLYSSVSTHMLLCRSVSMQMLLCIVRVAIYVFWQGGNTLLATGHTGRLGPLREQTTGAASSKQQAASGKLCT